MSIGIGIGIGIGIPQSGDGPNAVPQIFLDTDHDSDIDDVADLALLLALEARGECRVVGINNTSALSTAIGAIWGTLKFWGRETIPLGWTTSVGTTSAGGGDYDTPMNKAMGIPGHNLTSQFPSGSNNYRSVLAAATGKVIIITSGGFESLDNFLNSAADGISPLTGLQLATAKVDRIYMTAGHWPSGPAVSDMSTGKVFAADIFAICPVPLIAVDVSIDGSQTSGGGGTFTNMSFDEACRLEWVEYWNSNSPSNSRGFCAQFSIMFAVRGEAGLANRGGDNGQLTVNTSTGVTQWNSSPNQKQGYITDVNLIYPQASWPALVNGLILTPAHVSRSSLLTNGDFHTNDLTGWTNASTGTGTASGATGALVMVGVDTNNRGRVEQTITTVVGQVYDFALRGLSGLYNVALEKTLLQSDGPFTIVSQDPTVLKPIFRQFTADVTSYILRIENVAAGGTVTIDDIGIYLCPTSVNIANYSAETQALYNAMTVKPGPRRLQIIDDMITSLKTTGVWAQLDALWVVAAADAQAAKINWKNPGTFTLSPQGSPTFANDIGYTTNGTSSYLDTLINPSTQVGLNHTLNAAGMGKWSRLTGQNNTSVWVANDAVNSSFVAPRGTSNQVIMRINATASSTTNSAVNTDGSGFYHANRSGSTSLQLYKNGAALTLTTLPNQASSALPNATFTDGKNGSSTFGIAQSAALWISGSLTAQNVSDFYNAMLLYMQGVLLVP